MRRMLLLLLLGVLWAALAIAQDVPAADRSPTLSSSANTVQGCLSVLGQNYMLTQNGTGTSYRLLGNEDELKKHVGHEVAVIGEVTGSPEFEEFVTGQEQRETSLSSSAGVAIQVTEVTMIAESCSS